LRKNAFYFQGDNLISPVDISNSLICAGLPIELAEIFKQPDIFDIPAIDESSSIITGVSISMEEVLPENWKVIPVRQMITIMSTENINLSGVLRTFHIAQWRKDSKYCGTCGAENNTIPFQTQRLCPKCGRLEFPRICPAVIVLITDSENRILLAHNKRFREGLYSHISGFNEAGESLEETVVREIKEEINIEVKDIEYIKSQSWPFPNSLMLAFKAHYLSGTIKPDGEEIIDAKWFTKTNLPELPGEGSVSRALINNWLKE